MSASVAVASRSFSKNQILRDELLSRYDYVKFNDEGLKLYGESLIEFLDGFEKAITALEVIDEKVLARLPDLKVIGKYGVGLDMIDLGAMSKNDVKLGWTGGVNKRSVSELVISFSIALLHRVVYANSEVKDGKWYQIKGRQLSECVFGIVGCGHIGKDVVRLLKPYKCKILVYDILSYDDFYSKNDVYPVGLEYLLKQSDVITLHLPLDNTTRNILNEQRLKLIKDGSVLINLARGGLIEENVLKELLLQNKIGGAALDVFAIEPPTDNEIIHLDNVLVTPHIGGSTEQAILAMGMSAIDALENAKDPLSFI